MNPQAALVQKAYDSETLLYMAIDDSKSRWSVVFSDGSKIKCTSMVAGDFEKLGERIDRAASKLGLPDGFRVAACYEAGYGGFWLYRKLVNMGILAVVVDPGSVEQPKSSGKRPKTDRLDARRLVRKLVQFAAGDALVFSPVWVPDPDDEDDRRIGRERRRRVAERTGHINRIRQLLHTQGIKEMPSPREDDWKVWLDEVQTGDGRLLGEALKGELCRERRRFLQADALIEELEQVQAQWLEQRSQTQKAQMITQMTWLKSVGMQTAWTLVMEMFGWRKFRNRREVGAYVGLCGTPHKTAGKGPDKGMSKAGNAHVRALAIELAWNWVRWQPDSELTQWFNERFADHGSRMRRRGIVALSRKLLNRLRLFVETGEVPNGARLQT